MHRRTQRLPNPRQATIRRAIERASFAVLVLAATACGSGKETTEPAEKTAAGPRPEADFPAADREIQFQIADDLERTWTVAPELAPDTLRVECDDDKPTSVRFTSTLAERTFEVRTTEPIEFFVALNDGARAHTRIECVPVRIRFAGDYGEPGPLEERDLAAELAAGPLDAHLREMVEKRKIPGLAVVVTQGSETLFVGSYGVENIESGVAMTPDSPARLASATKVLTGLVFLAAAEDGVIDLDEPLEAYLDGTPDAWKGIPLWRVLNHTSGLPTMAKLEDHPAFADGGTDLSHRDLFDVLREFPLDFEPGSRMRYQQTGYSLLALLLMEQTGKGWDELLDEHVLRPAGMTQTRYGDSASGGPVNYELLDGAPAPTEYQYPRVMSMAGGYNTTAADLARLFHALHEGKIVDLDFLERQVLDPERLPEGQGYSLATIVKRFGTTPTLGHSGGGGLADLRFAPGERIGFAAVTNRGSSDLAYDVTDEVAEFLFGPPPS
ncbi:MAG: serine hydrolase domain-containing protein [Acidobacteriota bacterium]